MVKISTHVWSENFYNWWKFPPSLGRKLSRIGQNFHQCLVEFFYMLYQAIVSYPRHLICNLLNLYKDKVGAREFFFSKVSSDCKASIPLSVAPTLSLQRFKRLQIKWLKIRNNCLIQHGTNGHLCIKR